MDDLLAMVQRAQEFLASASEDLNAGRQSVAYESSRTAAELAGKALLKQKTGSYPREHAIGGRLYQEGLVPEGVDPSRLTRLLKESTRGDYGFHQPVQWEEAWTSHDMARRLVDSARQAVERT